MSNKYEMVIIEWLPEYLVESHIAANNFGVYPMNGAWRDEMPRWQAEEIIVADESGYAHIIGEQGRDVLCE